MGKGGGKGERDGDGLGLWEAALKAIGDVLDKWVVGWMGGGLARWVRKRWGWMMRCGAMRRGVWDGGNGLCCWVRG